MLTQEQISTIANKQHTTDLNVRREYVQHVFLSNFYQQSEASNIFFKGGTALRIIYKSPRYSEDIDFSSTLQTINEIETAVLETLHAIEKEGIQTEITESKETMGGYLATIFFEVGENRVAIQLEISFREKEVKGEVVTIANDFIPSYTVVSMSQDLLVKEKLDALVAREKPRDYYDLYFMLRANLLSVEDKSVCAQALQKLQKTQINFENELKQFLPKSHWLIIRDFKAALERELQRFV